MKPEIEARRIKRRKVELIRRRGERQIAALGEAPDATIFRNRKVLFGVMIVLAVLGGALIRQVEKANKERAKRPLLRVLREVDILAVALGRYHFHTGIWPTSEIGLKGLARHPGTANWNGPYISHSGTDPFGTPYTYKPPLNATNCPILFSCGPDKLPGTPDDIYPSSPEKFNPGTEWTNGWRSASERWIQVVHPPR